MPRAVRWWPPHCAWPCRSAPTWPRARPTAGPTPWSTSAGSSSTTRGPTPAAATALTSTWSSTSRTSSPAGAAGWSTGPQLDGPTVSRLFCDSAVHRVVMSGRSAVLDYGTATRTIPAPLWNALVIRDEHCRFPDCDRPSVWCEGHHVVWVTHGGPTELANLALVCSRHHHVLHQPGWHAKLLPDGRFEVTDTDGIVRDRHRHREPKRCCCRASPLWRSVQSPHGRMPHPVTITARSPRRRRSHDPHSGRCSTRRRGIGRAEDQRGQRRRDGRPGHDRRSSCIAAVLMVALLALLRTSHPIRVAGPRRQGPAGWDWASSFAGPTVSRSALAASRPACSPDGADDVSVR